MHELYEDIFPDPEPFPSLRKVAFVQCLVARPIEKMNNIKLIKYPIFADSLFSFQ